VHCRFRCRTRPVEGDPEEPGIRLLDTFHEGIADAMEVLGQPQTVEGKVKDAIRVRHDNQLEAESTKARERGRDIGGNRLPEIVLGVVGTQLTHRRRGSFSRVDTGRLEHHLHVHPRTLRIGGLAIPDPLVDLELDSRLCGREGVGGDRQAMPAQRVSDPRPVRKDQDAAGIQEERFEMAHESLKHFAGPLVRGTAT
jgi:hypothetical protein